MRPNDPTAATPDNSWSRVGFRDMVSAIPATAIWGVVTGVAMIQSGLTTLQAMGMTLIVYAGSAQLVSLPLLAAAVPLPIIWASALIVNLRFMIYALGFKPFFRRLNLTRRVLYGATAVDYLAAVFPRRFDRPPEDHGLLLQDAREIRDQPHLAYFRSAALTAWITWQTGSLIGMVLAQWIPVGWGLEFLATLALLAMLLPLLSDMLAVICVAVAAVVSVVLSHLPLNLGLLVAIMASVAVAMLLEGGGSSRRGGNDEASTTGTGGDHV
jgi:predicted branched-subunit amino acid permease